MKKNYPYLKDSDFIYTADLQRLQNQFIKITLLDWNENPLQEIQGIATGGSISLNGSSAVRRTCSLNMTVKEVSDGAISDTQNLISINKKIFLEVGIVNRTGKYEKEYPIIWYPQGVFVIAACSVQNALGQGVSLSAQFKDKMCLLNGECGGILPSSIRFDQYDTIDENGKYVTLKPTIQQIIRELVNHWGNEQLGRIIISDVDERLKMVMQWTGDYPVYMVNNSGSYSLTMNKSLIPSGAGYQTFEYGDDLGFIYTDFIWPSSWGELSNNAGDNICSVLDKIKNALGNYEYYYDVFGNFVWQEIKNYLNTTQAKTEIKNLQNNNYFIDITKGKSVYNFRDNKLAISFSNSPQYTKVKNDYIVWGIRENIKGKKFPIRYHLAIDKKPKIGNIYEVFFYTDPEDGLTKAKCPIKYETKDNFPETGVAGLFYMDMSTGIIYTWNVDTREYVTIEGSNVVSKPTKEAFPNPGDKDTIYLDESTGIKYIWGLDPESDHYKAIQALIDTRRLTYNQNIAPYVDRIDAINNIDKPYYQRQINELEETMSPYITRRNYLQKQLAKAEAELENYEVEKAGYEERKTNAQARVEELNIEIAQETDPVKKQALINQRDALLIDIDRLNILLASVAEDIIQTNDNIYNYNIEINSLNTTLEPYETQLAELNAELAALDAEIIENQDQIAILTIALDADLNALSEQQYEYLKANSTFSLVKVQTTDWRSELYLQGAAAEPLGLDSNYYYAELSVEWPKLYDLRAGHYEESGEIIYTGDFYQDVKDKPWDIDYMLDFIDTNTAIGGLSIDNIGRRSIVENKDSFNCVFEPDIPDFVLIETGQPDTEAKRRECENRGQAYIQTDSNVFTNLSSGGTRNSCFEEIKSLLWAYTNYNSNISIGAVPIYHLEPNTRITVQNKDSDIFGDYMINSISIPLNISGNMSISATQVQTKL